MLPVVTVVLIFGVNAVGKSSLGRNLAARLPRCAFIEVDELRYKVIEGLVAHSGGIQPHLDPDGYSLQCDMASRNAILLARGFSDHGFSSVIDGLQERYARRQAWLASQLPSARLIKVGLFCDGRTLRMRRVERGWHPKLPKGTSQKLNWYRKNRGGFDCVIDTAQVDSDLLAPILHVASLT
jgi:predicted kinase